MKTEVQKPSKACKKSFVVLPTMGKGFNSEVRQAKLESLDTTSKHVHINGIPFLFVIRYLVKNLPQLKSIRVTPQMEQRLKEHHLALLQEHGVQLETGYIRKGSGWKDKNCRFHRYKKNRAFFLGLSAESKEAFEELLTYKVPEALIAARYFCLSNESYVPLHRLHEVMEGVSKGATRLSLQINGLKDYLLKRQEEGERGVVYRSIARKLNACKDEEERKRKNLELAKTLQSLGLTSVPKNIPEDLISVYAKLKGMYEDGRLRKKLNPEEFRAVVVHFGLKNNIFLNYPRVSAKLKYAGEWVARRLVTQALAKLFPEKR